MRINRVSLQRKYSTSERHHCPHVDMVSLLCNFKHWIPIPEEVGIGSKETEAANKGVEKLQKVT